MNLGRRGDGCNFICSTLKSSANTRALSKPLPLQTRQFLQQPRRLHSRRLAARLPVGRQHNGGLVPGRRRQPQPKTQPRATPAGSSLAFLHAQGVAEGKRWGSASQTGCPSSTPLLALGQPLALDPAIMRREAPSRDAGGARGCAQHPMSRRNQMGPGFSWHRDVNTRTHAVPSGAAREHSLALCHALSLCPSCLLPSVPQAAWRGGARAGCCRIPMMPLGGYH